MTRHAVEALPTTVRLVRTHKHSSDARGNGAADFAKAMIGVQSSSARVRGAQEDRTNRFDLSADRLENDRSLQEAEVPDARFAPQPRPFMKEVVSAPKHAHEVEPEAVLKNGVVFRDATVEERTFSSMSQSSTMAQEDLGHTGPFDPRVFATPRTERVVVDQRVNPETTGASRDTTSDQMGGRDSTVGDSRTAFALSHTLGNVPLRVAALAIEVDVPHSSLAAGDIESVSRLSVSSATVPEAQDGIERMSVRVNAGVEPTFAVKEREEEAGPKPQWDIVNQRLQQDVALRLDWTAEPFGDAVSDSSTNPAANEDLDQNGTPLPTYSASKALDASSVMENVRERVGGGISHSTPSTEQNSTRVVAVARSKVIGPSSRDAVHGPNSASEPATDTAAIRLEQVPESLPPPEYGDASPTQLAGSFSKAASVVVASIGSRDLNGGKSVSAGMASVQADQDRLPAEAGSVLSQFNSKVRLQTISEGSAPTRLAPVLAVPAAVQTDGALEPRRDAAQSSNAEQTEPVEPKRDSREDSMRPEKQDASAAGTVKKPLAKEEDRNSARNDLPVSSQAARFSPTVSYDGAQSAGLQDLKHAGEAKLQTLGQILSTLQLELAALKKPESSPLKQLKIRLHPESLGEVDVTLKKNGRGIDVQLDASLGSTASALQAAKDELASALAELGFDRTGLSIEVKAGWQADVQNEASAGRDLQQAKPDIDQRNHAEQHSDRRRERNTDEGRNEQVERAGLAVRDGSAPRSKRGIYV